MTKTPNELKGMVRELENEGFNRLERALDRYQEQLYGHDRYADSLVESLHESIKTRVSMPSPQPNVSARQLEGILRATLSFHVEPPPDHKEQDRSPAKQRADKEERFYAWLWNQLDEGGKVSSSTRRYQVTAFAAWWLSLAAFCPPADEKDKEAQEHYRKTWSPFKLEVVDPRTVRFLRDPNGQPADLAARHFKMPYKRVAEVYGKAESDAHALEILNKSYPYLRGARGQSINEADLYSLNAEVWILDDSNTCCHTLTIKEGKNRRYEQVTEDYPNPWGGSPLIIVPGGYNVDAVNLEDAYEPLIKPLLRAQRIVDILDSHIASISLTPGKPVEQLPPEVAARLAGEDDPDREVAFSETGITTLAGTLGEIRLENDPMVKELRAMRLQDRDEAKPPPFLTNPDQGMVKYGDVTAQLQAVETSNRIYDSAREYFIEGVQLVSKKVKHAICYGDPWVIDKEATGEKVHFLHSSKERMGRQYAGDWAGKGEEIGPEDFGDADTLEISIVATSNAQKELEFKAAHEARMLGYKTWEDVVMTQTEDVSGQRLKVEEELRFQHNGPLIDNMQMLADIEEIVAEGGPDLSVIYNMGMQGPQENQGSPPADPNTLNVQTTMAPPTEGTSLSVTQ